MKSKKVVVAVGVAFGIAASFLAMIPSSHRSEAAIAVIDKKNIEEAIKTAIQTAKILTTQEKELALMVLNAKKIGPAEIQKIVDTQLGHQKKMLEEKLGQKGVLGRIYRVATNDPNADPLDIAWRDRLGDLQSIINGNSTVYDGVMNERRRQETLTETYKDAAKSAQNTQQTNMDIAKSTQEALENSNKAEGTMQVMQAGNAINANSVMALLQITKVYSNAVAAEASHYQAENIRRATVEANQQKSAERNIAAGQAALESIKSKK